METDYKIPIFIISNDDYFKEGLRHHLSESKIAPMDIREYTDENACLDDLSATATNIIFIDYDPKKVESLKASLDELSHALENYELVVRNPLSNKDPDKGHIDADADEFILSDANEFEEAEKIIQRFIKLEKKKNFFATTNYLLAGVSVVLLIVLFVVFLV